MGRRPIHRIVSVVLISLALIVFIFPIFWMLSASFKTEEEAFRMPPTLFGSTLQNYRAVLHSEFLLYILNSTVICSATVLISLMLGAPASYALSRFRFQAKENIAYWILTTRMGPPIAFALPMFLVMKFLHLVDTRLSLVILYTSFNLSFVIWLMRGFFDEIPRDLDEAALIDGCSPFQSFLRIIIPLVAPGLVAVAIFCFIFSWNEFFYALILTRTQSKTVTVGVEGFIGLYGIRWGEMTAAAALASAPILVFAILTQKHLVRGLTLGALK